MSGRIIRGKLVSIDDSGDQQFAEVLGGFNETLKKVHRIQPYGFHSYPPKDSHGVIAQFGGGPDGSRLLNFLLGFEHPESRPKNTKEGETRLYDKHGNVISIVESEIRYKHAKKKVFEIGDNITLTIDKDAGIDWKTPDGMKITHNGQNIGNGHKHGNTQPGGGTSGEPEA